MHQCEHVEFCTSVGILFYSIVHRIFYSYSGSAQIFPRCAIFSWLLLRKEFLSDVFVILMIYCVFQHMFLFLCNFPDFIYKLFYSLCFNLISNYKCARILGSTYQYAYNCQRILNISEQLKKLDQKYLNIIQIYLDYFLLCIIVHISPGFVSSQTFLSAAHCKAEHRKHKQICTKVNIGQSALTE